MTSGVYAITNRQNGHQYIGSAVDIRDRWGDHRRRLERGTHPSQALQRAWAKYGPDAFLFEVLEEVPDRANLLDREQYYLDLSYARPGGAHGYNARRIASSNLGLRANERQRAALAAQAGRPLTPEEHAALVEASAVKRRGVPLTAVHAAKIVAANKEREADPAYAHHRKRGLRALAERRKGNSFPDEHRAALKAAWERRRQRPMSEKQLAGYAGRRGRPVGETQQAGLQVRHDQQRASRKASTLALLAIIRAWPAESDLTRTALAAHAGITLTSCCRYCTWLQAEGLIDAQYRPL